MIYHGLQLSSGVLTQNTSITYQPKNTLLCSRQIKNTINRYDYSEIHKALPDASKDFDLQIIKKYMFFSHHHSIGKYPNGNEPRGSLKDGEFLGYLSSY